MKALLRNNLIWRGVRLHASDISWLGHRKQQFQIRFTDIISKIVYTSRISYFTPRLSSQNGWSPGHSLPPLLSSVSFLSSLHPGWKLQSTWVCSEPATMKEILGETENSYHVPDIIDCQINNTVSHFNHSSSLLDLKNYSKWKGTFKIKNVLWGSLL